MSGESEENKLKKLSFFKPVTLSWMSNASNIFAWINLIVAVLYLIFQIFNLDQQISSQNAITQAYFMVGHWWEWNNLTSEIVISSLFSVGRNFLTTAGNFILFKSIAIGLNILLELGFVILPDDKESENE